MNRIETTIQTAKLNSVDDEIVDIHIPTSSTSSSGEGQTSQKHYILSQVPSLTTDLSTLSYTLDKLAAEVDSVQSHGDEDVRRRKKELSTKLVDMMGVCDGFIKECGVGESSSS